MSLTTQGLIFLVLGWGLIAALSLFSFGRVLQVEKRRQSEGRGADGDLPGS